MNIVELEAQFRSDTGDDTVPYLWSSAVVLGLHNEAENEACRRKDLIFDNSTTAVCQISVTSSTAIYSLHAKVKKVTWASLTDTDGIKTTLAVMTRDALEERYPGWRDSTDIPYALIVDDNKVQIVPAPAASYTLNFEVYRLPLVAMFLPEAPVPTPPPDPLVVSPEIAEPHHFYLGYWAKHLAYSRRDRDEYDAAEAVKNEARFSRYFGPRATVDMGRSLRVNTPRCNKVWI